MQGEVYIRGRKRDGLISDEEISGLRIGLVSCRVTYTIFEVLLYFIVIFMVYM